MTDIESYASSTSNGRIVMSLHLLVAHVVDVEWVDVSDLCVLSFASFSGGDSVCRSILCNPHTV